jgi:hypothetical protein
MNPIESCIRNRAWPHDIGPSCLQPRNAAARIKFGPARERVGGLSHRAAQQFQEPCRFALRGRATVYPSAEASLLEMAGPAASAFGLGASGISGNQANDSAEVARIDINGYKLPAFTFAQLPAAPNGYIVFCVDCNTTCTWGGGKGRTCFRAGWSLGLLKIPTASVPTNGR